MTRSLSDRLAAYAFISPFVVAFAVFGLFAGVASFALSFTDWEGVSDGNFIGLANYAEMLRDESLHRAFLNTILVSLVVVPALTFGSLLVAWMIEARVIRIKPVASTLMLLPVLPSLVVVAFTFLWMMDPDYGLIGHLFRAFGVTPINIRTDSAASMPLIGMTIFWRSFGFALVIQLAGLQAFPSQVREAALVDGAGRWSYFWHILVPMSRPVLVFVSVLSTIGVFNAFEEPYVLYGPTGGRGEAGLMLGTYLYRTGFVEFDIGYTSAIAYFMVLVMVVVSLIQLRWGRAS